MFLLYYTFLGLKVQQVLEYIKECYRKEQGATNDTEKSRTV